MIMKACVLVGAVMFFSFSGQAIASDASPAEKILSSEERGKGDLFRLDVRKVFTAEEMVKLCDQHKIKLGKEGIERCYQRRPAFVTSRSPVQELAKYRAMVTMHANGAYNEGDVIEMKGKFETGNVDLEFVKIACQAGDEECKKDSKRGSTGKIDPTTGIGDVE